VSYDATTYPTDLLNHITKHVTRLFGFPSPADVPVQVVASQWPNAWFLWKPGVNWANIYPQIMKPFYQNIYMVGSALAPGALQLWAEGALRTVDDMMTSYFLH
jgi:hypothetical protein